MIQLRGIMNRVSIDKEGESKISFMIPLSEIMSVLSVAQMTERELVISIDEPLSYSGESFSSDNTELPNQGEPFDQV